MHPALKAYRADSEMIRGLELSDAAKLANSRNPQMRRAAEEIRIMAERHARNEYSRAKDEQSVDDVLDLVSAKQITKEVA
jgi:hypothetical protein